MRAFVTITDLTRMQGDLVCVADYLRDGTCIRPLFRGRHVSESWLWLRDMVVIRPFAEVELELLEHRPDPPHTEDWWVNPTYYRLVRMLKPDKRLSILERLEDHSVQAIFGAQIHHDNGWFVKAGEGTRSLGTIKCVEIEKMAYTQRPDGRWDYRIAFIDAAGAQYRLAVTDLAFRYYLDYMRLHRGVNAQQAAQDLTALLKDAELFLRIGLARGWDKYPDRCHLQITGVYSFPDYLEGKCFADFLPIGKSTKSADVEVPF